MPELLLKEGLLKSSGLIIPDLRGENYISLCHTAAYITKLKNGTLSPAEERRLGFPQSFPLWERELSIVTGTIINAIKSMEYGVSFNIAGGTHHAFSHKGEGFCLLNDIAVAACYCLFKGLAEKILIIDLDVHQGNGTAEIFAGNEKVFTFSMHGKNNYPLHKEKSSLDIELEDGCGDETYLNLLSETLPRLIEETEPGIIFYQAGVDILKTDKFGRLAITPEGCMQRDRIVFSTAKKNHIPVACSMGGGYSPDIANILEAHMNTYRVASELYF